MTDGEWLAWAAEHGVCASCADRVLSAFVVLTPAQAAQLIDLAESPPGSPEALRSRPALLATAAQVDALTPRMRGEQTRVERLREAGW